MCMCLTCSAILELSSWWTPVVLVSFGYNETLFLDFVFKLLKLIQKVENRILQNHQLCSYFQVKQVVIIKSVYR